LSMPVFITGAWWPRFFKKKVIFSIDQ
jgi:hypothetical protein